MKNFIVISDSKSGDVAAETVTTREEMKEFIEANGEMSKDQLLDFESVWSDQPVGDTSYFQMEGHEVSIVRKKDIVTFDAKEGEFVQAIGIINNDINYYHPYALITLSQKDIAAIKSAHHLANQITTPMFAGYVPVFAGEVCVFEENLDDFNWEEAEEINQNDEEGDTYSISSQIPDCVTNAPDIVNHKVIYVFKDGDLYIELDTYGNDKIELKISAEKFKEIFN